MRTSTIVVAVDGTEPSRAAVRWAAREAVRDDRPLLLVHVLDWDAAANRYDFSGRRFDAAHRVADDIAARAAEEARTAAAVQVSTRVLAGDPAAQLVIASEQSGLMVLGHRGHGGFPGLGLGSVSQRVAMHAHCPVAVVRGRTDADGPVAVGADDADTADEVLETAFTAARDLGTSLVVVRSYLPVLPTYRGGFPPAEVHTPEQDDAERARLQEQLSPWRLKFPDVPVEVLLSHDTAAAVLNGVSHGSRLLVVGSRGHGVFTGTLLGSTGLQLLHHAGCPVLIVRPYR